jgi:ketosteroid isomerase-like protein
VVVLAMTGLAMGFPALAASSPEAEAVVDSFHSALAKGDTKAAAAFLSDDALIFEEGGAERSKGEYAAAHLPADAAFAQVIRISPTRRFGDAANGMAWVASEARMTGTYKGRAIDRLTTETMLLRETADGWKIVHVHWSSMAAPTKAHSH